MSSLGAKPYRLYETFVLAILLCISVSAQAQEKVVVAVMQDGPSDRMERQQQIYIDELLALTRSDFDVEIRRLSGNWDKATIEQSLDAAYADEEVDQVLVLGFVANQLAATRTTFPKPTFLPLILDTGLLASQPVDGKSGIKDLNYLSAYANFASDLDTLARFVTYRKLVLFVDESISSAIPVLRDAAIKTSKAKGLELVMVTHDGSDHRLMNRVPEGTDAVFMAALPRMPSANFVQLIDDINAAGLPSFSFTGVVDVERGLLVTDREPRDVDRHARLNALNMQAVMLGDRPEEQPIAALQKEQLTINMATARKIGLSPSFDVLSDAVLLNRVADATGDEYGLVEIARIAIEQNQDLLAETYGTQAGLEEIARARANLLPQIGCVGKPYDAQGVDCGVRRTVRRAKQ